MRRLARTLGVLGGSVLLTLGLTQSANAATGWLAVNGQSVQNPPRHSCATPTNPRECMAVLNGTDTVVWIHQCPGCCGHPTGLLPARSNGVFHYGFSVHVPA